MYAFKLIPRIKETTFVDADNYKAPNLNEDSYHGFKLKTYGKRPKHIF